jgi:hypothetical protein
MNRFTADVDEVHPVFAPLCYLNILFAQLIELMHSHQKHHVEELTKIEMESTILDSSPELGMLAPEVENIWTSVIKNFEKGCSN